MNSLYWIEELLPNEVISKKMPNGVGYYLEDKFILFLSEDSKTTLHKGITYPFQLFFGVFFPIAKFQFLENHPVKKEWLYLPAENENFEDEVKLVLREVLKKNPLFGIPVKENPKPAPQPRQQPKKPKTSKKAENEFLLSLAKRRITKS